MLDKKLFNKRNAKIKDERIFNTIFATSFGISHKNKNIYIKIVIK